MKKLIVRTIITTILLIIAVGMVAYAVVGVVSPKTLYNFYSKTGSYSLSVRYAEKQYKKTSDFDDLKILCDTLDEKKSASKTVEYLEKFLTDANFEDFSKSSSTSTTKMGTAEYYSGKLVIAIYVDSGIANAISKAEQIVKNRSYTEYNPFYQLILDCGESFSAEDKNAMSNKISTLKENLTASELVYAERDLSLLK